MCALGFTFRSFLVTKVQQSLLVAEWSVQGAATWVPPLLAKIDIYSWCAYSRFLWTSHRQLFWVFPSPAWESPSISSRTGLWASASQNFFFSLVISPYWKRLVWLSPLFDYQSMNEWLISNEKFGDVSGLVQGRLIFICIVLADWPTEYHIKVTGFEPMALCTQNRCADQTALHLVSPPEQLDPPNEPQTFTSSARPLRSGFEPLTQGFSVLCSNLLSYLNHWQSLFFIYERPSGGACSRTESRHGPRSVAIDATKKRRSAPFH